jgi:beta-glucosidase
VNPFRQELSTATSNPLPRSALNSTKVTLPPVTTGGVMHQNEADDSDTSEGDGYSTDDTTTTTTDKSSATGN